MPKPLPVAPPAPPGSLAAALAAVPDPRHSLGWLPDRAPLSLVGMVQTAGVLSGRVAMFGRRRDEANQYDVLGKPLVCPICDHDRFILRRSLLNTRALTLLDLDWANRRAINFVHERCGHVLWFVPQR